MNGTDEKNGIKTDNEVEAHLESCPECAEKLKCLDGMIASLKDHKDVFCPEIWQLNDFVKYRDDPTGEIEEHVGHCSPCAAKVEEFRAAAATQPSMPPRLTQALQREFPPPHPSEGLVSRIQAFFATFLRFPALGLATAAAAVLLVVVMYPRESAPPMLGLSSVSWDGNLKLMHPEVSPIEGKKPRVAMILLFKDFSPMWPQARIDDLYKALKPGKDLTDKFEFVSPDEVSESIGQEKAVVDKSPPVERLHKDLDVSKLVVITLRSDGTAVTVDAAIVDAEARVLVKTRTERRVQSVDLPEALKKTVESLLRSEVD